jgi:tol-pal system protein YbgF
MSRRAIAAALLAGMAAAQAADIPDRRAPAGTAARPPTVAEQQRQTLVDLYLQVEQLQNEIRQLRGLVETQNFELERLKGRHRDTAADFDKRLREVERQSEPRAADAPAAVGDTPAAPGVAAAPPPAPAPSAPATPPSAQEQREYDAAFQLLRQSAYDRAIKAFRAFLGKYPRSELADNAQYWIGEAQYVVRNFKGALEEFERVVRDYPGSDKAPDAQLKIGYCHLELGETAKAREALTQLSTRYPASRAAKVGDKRLAEMKKEKK